MRALAIVGLVVATALATTAAVRWHDGHQAALSNVVGEPDTMAVGVAFSPVATRLPPDELADFAVRIETIEMRGDYAALEKLAVAYRHVDIRFAGGRPKIASFYAALGTFDRCPCGSDRQSLIPFGAKLRAIAGWMAAVPRSPAAAVAMASLLRNYAWVQRGRDFEQDTDTRRMTAFKDTTQRSIAYLLPLDPRTDPAIFAGLLSAVRASDAGRSEMDRIFPASVAAFPSYFPYYETEADLLQERWFGAPGEAARFLAALPSLGDIGLVAYADAVGKLDASNATSNLHHIFGTDWPILRRAFETRRRLYGTNPILQNEEMKLAVVNDDRGYAADLLNLIGPRWAPVVWQRYSAFAAASAWARGAPGAPPELD